MRFAPSALVRCHTAHGIIDWRPCTHARAWRVGIDSPGFSPPAHAVVFMWSAWPATVCGRAPRARTHSHERSLWRSCAQGDMPHALAQLMASTQAGVLNPRAMAAGSQAGLSSLRRAARRVVTDKNTGVYCSVHHLCGYLYIIWDIWESNGNC